ncbi:hypothetical protein GGR56DRAFT_622943 [Xylariaceae sp. FL0804]|nr:hypothetical protein GGR56DRAFT_622943 [Xylariaceae sp. FL0804]
MEVTIALLEGAMKAALEEKKEKEEGENNNSNNNEKQNKGSSSRFLIDGFPRKFDQAVTFERAVCPAKCVLFYDCPEAELERRLLERGKTSGRADDNADSIRKRFRTFVDTSMPVVRHYEAEGRVVRVDAARPPDDVERKTNEELARVLGPDF